MADTEQFDGLDALIKCIYTSNILLNSYFEETEPGVKKDTILHMIETNTQATILALENEGNINRMVELEYVDFSARLYTPEQVAKYTMIVCNLEEIRDSNTGHVRNIISETIDLLKNGKINTQ